MEASAPGRARRGGRRARAAGSPLSRAAVVLLLSAFAARAPPSGEAPPPGLRGAAAPRWGFWVTCPRRRGSATGLGHVSPAPRRRDGTCVWSRGRSAGARFTGGRAGTCLWQGSRWPRRWTMRGQRSGKARGSVSERSGLSAVRDMWRPVLGVFQRERAPPVCHCPRSSGSLVLVVSVNTGKTGILKFDFLWPFVCSFVSGESKYLSVSLSKCI